MFINCYSIKWKLHTLKKKINKMKLIKNLDGVNKIWRKQYIIIINVLRITDCDENRDARLICFSARFINHFYLFVDEREDIQKRSFTKWINSQLSKVRLKTSKSNSDITRSTWGCKNELWQILYYNSGRWQQVQYNF